jgi:hypothetical protein
VARQYACIMASLGMTLVLMRALRNGEGFESTLVSALFWMVTLGGVGFMVASIARSTIDESVRQRMEEEINNAQAAISTQPSAISQT